jgi:hypothetical protein
MRYLLYSILAGALAGGAVMAKQTTTQEPQTPPAEEPGTPQQAPPQEKDSQAESTKEDELESFTPTEKVPADSAISFPVDI